MNVTLTVGTYDFSPFLSTYKVTKETSYQTEVTTMAGVEFVGGGRSRDIITFSLFPCNDELANDYYDALKNKVVSVTYTQPHTFREVTQQMRVVSDLEQIFGLTSVDGWRYYKGNEIVLRAMRCD